MKLTEIKFKSKLFDSNKINFEFDNFLNVAAMPRLSKEIIRSQILLYVLLL